MPDLAALDERPAPGSTDEEVIGLGRGHRAAAVDLARGGGAAAGAGARAPVDDRVRQLPAAGRAADLPAQRAGRRGGRTRGRDEDRRRDALPGRGDRAVRDRRAARRRPSPGPTTARCRASSARSWRRSSRPGLLPCVVATSWLELGIDMGAVDLVVQVEAPPSVASGLQRVGRAGHQVGAVSAGRGVPEVPGRPGVVRGGRGADGAAGAIESMRYPRNPLDVLAQQIVAMVALEPWTLDDLAAVVRRAAPFAALPDSALHSVLDMLAGRYPSEEFGELRARITWDRVTDELRGRPGAQRLAVTSGGTIPDRGLFTVMTPGGADGAGSRVGELDEEMVYESRVGDTFLLGTSSWRVEDITHDRVIVTPAPGVPARMPFWKGESIGRPLELGRAVGAFVREMSGLDDEAARERATAAGLDEWAADNLLAYLREQREATRHVPERPHDPGRAVPRRAGRLAAGRALAVRRRRSTRRGRWRSRPGCGSGAASRCSAAGADDGIVLRLPDAVDDSGAEVVPTRGGRAARPGGGRADRGRRAGRLGAVRVPVPGVRGAVAAAAAARPEAAQPAVAAAAALGAAAGRGRQVRAVPGHARGDAGVRAGRLRPAGAARADDRRRRAEGAGRRGGDAAARRRSRAACCSATSGCSSTRPTRRWPSGGPPRCRWTPRCWPSCSGSEAIRELLDPEVLAEVEAVAAAHSPRTGTRATPRARPTCCGSSATSPTDEAAARGVAPEWLRRAGAARRAIRVRIAGEERWIAIEDAGRMRDALGTALPVGVPEAFTEPVADPLGDLVRATPARTGRSPPPSARPGSGWASPW